MNFIFIILVLIFVILITKPPPLPNNNNNNTTTTIVSNDKREKEIITPNFEDNSLSNVLNNISRGNKILLKNIQETWSVTKDTIDSELNQKIMTIIKSIIKAVGGITGNEYYSKTIENMYVMKDDINNYRCILNAFIYDINNYFTIKLILDIVSIDEEIYINFIDLDVSSNDNIVNNYDIKFDSHGILSDYNMFDENVSQILDDYYGRNFEVIQLDYKNKYYIDTSATFTLNQLRNYYFPSNTPIQKSSSLFCKKYTNDWNMRPIKTKNKDCLRNNNSYEAFPNIPHNIPGAITTNPDKNEFTWLFNSDRGVINSNN